MRVRNYRGMGLNNEHKRERNKGLEINNSIRPNDRSKSLNNEGMRVNYRPMGAIFVSI